MVVDSVIDAYGLALGFYVYNVLWDIFVSTGLVYIPIIGLVLGAVKGSLESSQENWDSKSSLRTVVMGMFMIVLALELAIYPMVKFEIEDIKYYKRQCTSDSTTGGTITTEIAGEEAEFVTGNMVAQLGGRDIRLPVLFYVGIAMAQGIKNWAVQDLPCTTDIRLISDGMLNQRITDPVLLQETQKFIRWCFNPARMKWLREEGLALQDDQNWPGGRNLIVDIGYYDNAEGNGFYSKEAFYGFGGSSNKIAESENLPSGYGYPTCKEWWLGVGVTNTPYVSEHGLSTRLYNSLEDWLKENEDEVYDSLVTQLNRVKKYNYVYIAKKDAVVHQSLFTPIKLGQLNSVSTLDYGTQGDDGVTDWLFRGLGTVGLATKSVSQFSGASMLQLAMPMVKPFIMMLVIIAFVPAIIMGRYKWKYIGLFIGVLMSISFWPFFWELSRLIDDTLLTALEIDFDEINTQLFSQWIASGLYLYAPVVFSMALGWVGLASVDSAMGNMAGGAGSAGKSGSGAVKGGINKGKNYVKTKMGAKS